MSVWSCYRMRRIMSKAPTHWAWFSGPSSLARSSTMVEMKQKKLEGPLLPSDFSQNLGSTILWGECNYSLYLWWNIECNTNGKYFLLKVLPLEIVKCWKVFTYIEFEVIFWSGRKIAALCYVLIYLFDWDNCVCQSVRFSSLDLFSFLPFGVLFLVSSQVIEFQDWEIISKLGKLIGVVHAGYVHFFAVLSMKLHHY